MIMTDFDLSGLLEPQKAHAQFLVESLIANGISIDDSTTGTGKTYVGCAIARHLKRKFVVICPKIAIPMWKRVLASFGLTPEFVLNPEKLMRGNTPYYKRISPAKYRAKYGLDDSVGEIPPFMCAEWKMPKDWIILIDEVHKCKGVESLNAGGLFNLKSEGYSVHGMSATLATTPTDMRATGYAVGLHSHGPDARFNQRAFKKFCEEAGAEWVGKWGAMYFDASNPESLAKLQVVHDYLHRWKKIASRLTRKDFGAIFPATQVVTEAYDMGTASVAIKAVYDEMELELDLLEEHCANYKDHILAIITKARRHAEMLKVPTIIDMVCDYNREGRSAVVFVNYTATIEAIMLRLGKEFDPKLIGRIDGKTTAAEKEKAQQGFQADVLHFMVANLAAGGQSINLHDILGVRPRSSIINPSYSAISVLQSAGRIDRAYTQSDVYQRLLYAAGTIEENVCRRFNDRSMFITALNDGTLTDADLIPTEKMIRFTRGLTGMIR